MKRKRVLLPNRKRKYHFDELRVGESIGIELRGPLDLNRYRVAAVAAAKRLGHGARFSVKQLPNGNYRCWRVS